MFPNRRLLTAADAPHFIVLPPPPILYIPSSSLANGSAPEWKPVGTRVEAGGALTHAHPEMQASSIAPISGTLGDPVVVRLTGGKNAEAIELHVERDGDSIDQPALAASAADRLDGITTADAGSWLAKLAQLGVTAHRWTSPDLLGQLREALRRPIDTIVCNLLDSDPWLAVNRAAAGAWPVELAAGLALLARLTSAANTWVLFDQAEPIESFASLGQACGALPASEIRLAPIENDYPQPDPTLLVYGATRRRLKPGRLPSDQGVLLLDAAAAVTVGRALLTGRSTPRVPVVTYDQPSNAVFLVEALVGTTLGAMFEHLAIPDSVREVYVGSPLRQLKSHSHDVIAAGEPTFFAAAPQPAAMITPCIRCGWCIEGCPTRCNPAGLLEAAQKNDLGVARRNGLDACIECGLCTYVCPSQLPILRGIRGLRLHA